jgi:hypothetical protein
MVHTSGDMINQVMGSTKGMGFNWVKQQIEWRVFEGSPGAIDFGSSDPIVNAANAAGVNLLFSVVNAPAWAREPGFRRQRRRSASGSADLCQFCGRNGRQILWLVAQDDRSVERAEPAL